jgi:hypothetical protein
MPRHEGTGSGTGSPRRVGARDYVADSLRDLVVWGRIRVRFAVKTGSALIEQKIPLSTQAPTFAPLRPSESPDKRSCRTRRASAAL